MVFIHDAVENPAANGDEGAPEANHAVHDLNRPQGNLRRRQLVETPPQPPPPQCECVHTSTVYNLAFFFSPATPEGAYCTPWGKYVTVTIALVALILVLWYVNAITTAPSPSVTPGT